MRLVGHTQKMNGERVGGSDPKNDNHGGTAGTARAARKFVAFAGIRRFGVGVDQV